MPGGYFIFMASLLVRESDILEQDQPPSVFNISPYLDLKPVKSLLFRSNKSDSSRSRTVRVKK